MNSTDEQKKAIIAMFKAPIDEVEEAFEEVSHECTEQCRFPESEALLKLRQKIQNLKAKLPMDQEE